MDDHHYKTFPEEGGCMAILVVLLVWILLAVIVMNVPRYNKDSDKQAQDANQPIAIVSNCNCGNQNK